MPRDQTNPDQHIDDPFDAEEMAQQPSGELDDEELDELFDLEDLDEDEDELDEDEDEYVEGEGPDA